jgi:hypothetical protein
MRVSRKKRPGERQPALWSMFIAVPRSTQCGSITHGGGEASGNRARAVLILVCVSDASVYQK